MSARERKTFESDRRRFGRKPHTPYPPVALAKQEPATMADARPLRPPIQSQDRSACGHPQRERRVCEKTADRRNDARAGGSASMLGGRRSAGADRSEAQLPTTHRTREAVEAVRKETGPAIFVQAGPFFFSSKLRRTASQVTAPQAVARAIQPKLRLSPLWIMNPTPQPAAAFTPGTRVCP
jgi:hypothetical protein